MKKPFKYFIIGILTILLPLGLFILFIYSLSFAFFGGKNSKDDIHTLSTLNSPDNKFIATTFYYSGGGAAGWTGRKVNIRKSDEDFSDREFVFSASSGTDIQTVWENDSTLQINYSTDDRILSLYQKEWNSDKTVKIIYNQK